jgi:hypothetical protein
MITRIDVGDFDAWKPMFDQDQPGARANSAGWRLFRSVENPGEVYIQVEFRSLDEAKEGRERLLASGVLDRFADRHGPAIVEEAETVTR